MKSKNSDNAIIIFQKNLVLGKVKTRLAATVGNQEAMEIYRALVGFTYKQASEVKEADVWIFFSESIEEIGKRYQQHIKGKMVQEGSELGERMLHAFETIFGMGYKKAVLIGTDCPEITPEILDTSLDSLQTNEAVVGPAMDGGYYLIGMDRVYPQLFYQMPWSTEEVLTITLQKLNKDNLSHYLLPVLSDIDTEEDWLKFETLISEKN